MYKLVFLTLAVAIILLVPISFSQTDQENTASDRCMSDTDGGKNFLKAGTVITQSKNHTDTCSLINDTQENLIEYSCKFSGSEYGSLVVTNQDCSKLGPYACLEGACVIKNASAVNQSPEISQPQSPVPVVVYPTPEPSPITVVVPQPVIGSKCTKTVDGAKITRPVTGQEIPYTDFEAEDEKVTYGCNGDILTQTRAKTSGTKEPEGDERIDITQYPRVYDLFKEMAQITKEDVLNALFMAANPLSIIMFNVIGENGEKLGCEEGVKLSISVYFRGIDKLNSNEDRFRNLLRQERDTANFNNNCCGNIFLAPEYDQDKDIKENARIVADSINQIVKVYKIIGSPKEGIKSVNVHLIGFSTGGLVAIETANNINISSEIESQIDIVTIATPYGGFGSYGPQFAEALCRLPIVDKIVGVFGGDVLSCSVGHQDYGGVSVPKNLCSFTALVTEREGDSGDTIAGGTKHRPDPNQLGEGWNPSVISIGEVNHTEAVLEAWKSNQHLFSPSCGCNTQKPEPERLKNAERKKADLPKNYPTFLDGVSVIIKNELPSLLFVMAQPNAMFVSMVGGVSTYCKDTDTTIDGNSDNPFEAGSATLVIKGQQKERKTDICGTELDHGIRRYLVELICKPGGIFSNPKIETINHDCLGEFGLECFDGACYQFEPLRECFDSDAGNQPTESGWVIPQEGGYAILDRCSQPSSRVTSTVYKGVLERECRRDGTVGTVDINCGTGRRCENPGNSIEDACTSQWAE